jgi:WD40 repeat protein
MPSQRSAPFLVALLAACSAVPTARPPVTIALPPPYTPTPVLPTPSPPLPSPTPTRPPLTPALIAERTLPHLAVIQSWQVWGLDAMAWSSDGSMFAIAGSFTSDAYEDQGVSLFSARTLDKLWSIRGDYDNLAFSPDAATLAATGFNGTDLIDVDSGAVRSHPDCVGGMFVAYSSDGRLLAQARSSADDITYISLVSPDGGTCIAELQYPGWARSLAVSPTGEYVAAQLGTTTDEVVVVWDVESATEICHFSGLTPFYSPDSEYIVVPSIEDWTTELRDPASCRLVAKLAGEGYPLAFRPDGMLSLDTEDGAISTWDLASLQPIGRMPGFPYPEAWHMVSPDWHSLLAVVLSQFASEPSTLLFLQAPNE